MKRLVSYIARPLHTGPLSMRNINVCLTRSWTSSRMLTKWLTVTKSTDWLHCLPISGRKTQTYNQSYHNIDCNVLRTVLQRSYYVSSMSLIWSSSTVLHTDKAGQNLVIKVCRPTLGQFVTPKFLRVKTTTVIILGIVTKDPTQRWLSTGVSVEGEVQWVNLLAGLRKCIQQTHFTLITSGSREPATCRHWLTW